MSDEKPEPVGGPRPKFRRSLRNILVRPAGQLRIVFGVPVIVLLVVGFSFWQLMNSLSGALENLRDTSPVVRAQTTALIEAVHSVFGAGILCAFGGSLLIAIWGLSISHHFYGPLVPLLRKLDQMKEGNFAGLVHLRKEDELKEIARAINELSEKMEKFSK